MFVLERFLQFPTDKLYETNIHITTFTYLISARKIIWNRSYIHFVRLKLVTLNCLFVKRLLVLRKGAHAMREHALGWRYIVNRIASTTLKKVWWAFRWIKTNCISWLRIRLSSGVSLSGVIHTLFGASTMLHGCLVIFSRQNSLDNILNCCIWNFRLISMEGLGGVLGCNFRGSKKFVFIQLISTHFLGAFRTELSLNVIEPFDFFTS